MIQEKERYLVCTMDGEMHMVIADTFAEVLTIFRDDNIWQITKMHYEVEK